MKKNGPDGAIAEVEKAEAISGGSGSLMELREAIARTPTARRRRNALRIVRFVEYGAPLPQLHGRETLIECKRRPGRERCTGWMWVVKQNDDRIQVHCPTCHEVEAVISGWQETLCGTKVRWSRSR